MTLESFGVKKENDPASPPGWVELGIFRTKTEAVEMIAEENSRSRIYDRIEKMGTVEELPDGRFRAMIRTGPPGWSSTMEKLEREKRMKRKGEKHEGMRDLLWSEKGHILYINSGRRRAVSCRSSGPGLPALRRERDGGRMKPDTADFLPVLYICGPFSGPDPHDVEMNILRASRIAYDAWIAGWAVICPHKNTAGYQNYGHPNEFWIKGDLSLLIRCDAILLVPGWRQSRGSLREFDHAAFYQIPVFDYEQSGIPSPLPFYSRDQRCILRDRGIEKGAGK